MPQPPERHSTPGTHFSLHQRWAVAVLAVLWVMVTALLALKLAGETTDDFFITFRYSQNLLAGKGFVFNAGERVFGTTAPGWGLLVALLSAVSGLAPAIAATFATALALLTTAGWLLWKSQLRGRLPEAALAGTLMLTNSFLWVHNGSETFTATALLVLAAGISRKRPGTAGLLAGFAVWLRPESGLAGLILAAICWSKERSFPWRFGVVFSLIVGGGLAWAALYFGEALPNTLQAKRLQSAWNPQVWASGLAFWREGWHWLSVAYAGPWIGVLVVGGGAGLVSLLRSGQRSLQLLAAHGLALLLLYPLLGIPFYTWYAIPFLIALLYGLAFLAGDLWRLVWRLVWRWLAWRRLSWRPAAVVVSLLVLAPVALLVSHVSRRMADGYRHFEAIPQTELYREAGEWLRQHAAPGADIAYVEVGALAYYSDRPVRDLLGLVSPENLEFVARRDLAAALRAHPAVFVIHHTRLAGLMDPVIQQSWFDTAYEPIMAFEGELTPDVLTLYRRRASSLPTQRNNGHPTP